MIVLFTDFGLEGPYTGQVEAVLARHAPGVPVIRLFSDLPTFAIQAAAYLLPAYACGFPPETVFLCVVDPGVGGARPGAVMAADGHWYVGPDEGLFSLLARRASRVEWYELAPVEDAAPSFHGRDVFAPVAARLARDGKVPGERVAWEERVRLDWPDELLQVVYIDRFGNAITGMRAAALPANAVLEVNGRQLRPARTFSAVPPGAAFWYENANGLVEFAVNRGRAAAVLGLDIGSRFLVSG